MAENLLQVSVPLLQPGARHFRLIDALQSVEPPVSGMSARQTLTENVITRAELDALQAAIDQINQRLSNAGIP